METIELSKTLRESARQKGLCDEWYNDWEDDTNAETLVEKMYKGLDFVLKHHWPSNDFIKENFNLGFLRKNKVFVDDKYSIVDPEQSLILGKSEIRVRYNAAHHGIIHVRDNSSVKLTAKNRCFVIVHLYDKAHIDANQFDSARIVLILHSTDATFIAGKDVTIKEEYNYLRD